MKKKILLTSIIGILLLTSCAKNVDIEKTNNTEVVTTTENPIENNEIELIDGIYGLYGTDEGAIYQDYISVFKGKDENHIDIDAYFYRTAAFFINDLEIIKNENGELIATKQLDTVPEFVVYGQDTTGAKVDVIIKDDRIKLEFDKGVNRIIIKDKVKLKCITEENKQKALDNLLKSDFTDINKDIFEIIHDTENYLVVRVRSYIGQIKLAKTASRKATGLITLL